MDKQESFTSVSWDFTAPPPEFPEIADITVKIERSADGKAFNVVDQMAVSPFANHSRFETLQEAMDNALGMAKTLTNLGMVVRLEEIAEPKNYFATGHRDFLHDEERRYWPHQTITDRMARRETPIIVSSDFATIEARILATLAAKGSLGPGGALGAFYGGKVGGSMAEASYFSDEMLRYCEQDVKLERELHSLFYPPLSRWQRFIGFVQRIFRRLSWVK